jgi:hypothetical protein
MTKLICSYCGLDQWIDAGFALATDPPISVYYCAHCGKAAHVRQVEPENRPHVIYVPDEEEAEDEEEGL